MAKSLSDAATDDYEDSFEDDAAAKDYSAVIGGRDSSIRRRIEERMERRRLMEDLGLGEGKFDF
ncbi:MAG: hypothetical protein ACI9G5_000234 [Paracoccaceae bacterium]|jgi:hypothetical protein